MRPWEPKSEAMTQPLVAGASLLPTLSQSNLKTWR